MNAPPPAEMQPRGRRTPVALPARGLTLAAALLLASGAAATQLALTPPWLGIALKSQLPGPPILTEVRGPSAKLPVGAAVVAIGDVLLEDQDLVEEPDYFDTYPEMATFFRRQSALTRALEAPTVTLRLREGNRESFYSVTPTRRPLSSLPALFWFPLLAGLFAALLGLWVAVLRPSGHQRFGDANANATGAVLFAALGICIPIFTVPAAIYGTREIALPGGIFHALSVVNHLGALSFGIFLLLLFLSFPRPLLSAKARLAVPILFGLWILADAFRIAPDQSWGSRIPTMLEMVGAIVAGVVAWIRAKRDPAARATLRWFGVSVLLGASLFVFSTIGTSFLGGIPELPQGYAFGFFLLMFVGLAIGVRRHALFELNTWAYRILFGVLGATALVALDAGLALLLPRNRLLASSASLLAVGLVYFPLRNWLWGRIVREKTVDGDALFRDLLAVTFAKDHTEISAQWQALLQKTFDADPQPAQLLADTGAGPVEQAPREGEQVLVRPEPPTAVTKRRAREQVRRAREQVLLVDEGTALLVPPIANLDGTSEVYLRYPWKGRGLFGEQHRALVEAAWRFLGHALAARDAFARGAREERARIAADLHDDVGARLLTSLHEENAAARATVRTAIGEMRGIVHELVGKTQEVGLLEADLRHETFSRLEAAGIAVTWPIPKESSPEVEVSYRFSRHLASMVREALSNVIRHAQAKEVVVEWAGDAGQLRVAIADDGRGLPAAERAGGNGLAGLRRRAALLGGSVVIRSRAGAAEAGTIVEIVLPLAIARHRSEA